MVKRNGTAMASHFTHLGRDSSPPKGNSCCPKCLNMFKMLISQIYLILGHLIADKNPCKPFGRKNALCGIQCIMPCQVCRGFGHLAVKTVEKKVAVAFRCYLKEIQGL